MIRVRVSSFVELEKEIQRATRNVPKAAAEGAANYIREQADAGQDVKGKKFEPYSDAYKKFRQKNGLSTDPPNLRVTGHLLDRRVTKSGDKKSSLFPSASDRLKAEGLMKKRMFYPETDSDITTDLENRVVKAGEKVIK
jgi:hypothetical protein